MPESRATKNFFSFNKGLNTESNEISFPDGYSTDERNYELLLDGSRRRRKGLQVESGGSSKTVSTAITATQKQCSHKWRSVGGDVDKHFIVHQVGGVLYFSDDAELISTTYHGTQIDLDSFLVDSATYSATDIAGEFCDFTTGRGYLFVANKFINPFYVAYDATADTFTAEIITLLVRDFDGIDDGIGVSAEPIDATIPDDHRYNLRNNGWKQKDIDQFHTDTSTRWPAKNAIWYKGYKRTYASSVAEEDGTRSWDSTKMDAEVFGNAAAARGSLFLNPFDTTYAVTLADATNQVAISTWAFTTGSVAAGGVIKVTTVANHGRTDGEEVTISGVRATYNTGGSEPLYLTYDRLNATHTIANKTPTTFEVTVLGTSNFDSWVSQYSNLGQVDGGESVVKSDGTAYKLGCTHVEYHHGHVFYLGFGSTEYADTIAFSQVAQRPAKFGQCHQYQDPTDENFNALVPSDGGHIVLPKMGKVTGALSTSNALIVFSDNGVWEIGGGQRSIFTADGYSIRQLTNAECNAPKSPITFDTGTLYTGPKGIYLINPNQNTGQLTATNISEQLVQTKWNAIPDANKKLTKTVYDDALRRVYIFYGDGTYDDTTAADTNEYRFALILDLKVGAWYPFEYNMDSATAILDVYSITDGDSPADNTKIKYTVRTATDKVDTCDLDSTDYLDPDGTESPLPYAVTGWDNTGDFQRRKQAPIVTVYAKRTETGYTASGNGWTGDNESSNLLTGYWDWTDDSVSGKITSQIETYRHVRSFVPASATDIDGYPVVTTRNKLRGRGRVLQLRFDGAATKDSHLLGWTTNYKVSRKV